MDTIDLYEAIGEMRKRTARGETFAFAHATLNRDRGTSDGIRYVSRARLRPAAKGDDVVNADFKIFYYDEDLKEPRICWQPLIMFFEDKQVTLN